MVSLVAGMSGVSCNTGDSGKFRIRESPVSSWSCRYEVDGLCKKVDGAYCRPGMKGCILVGKVTFQDGVIPSPVWPEGARRRPDGPGEPPSEG
jgi:hypothetical protein